jgi:hypothetical protein
MTESDWLSTDNPFRLFQHVRSRLSARKLQLLACGCCRLLAPHLSAAQWEALGVVERHADGLADADAFQQVKDRWLGEVRDMVVATPTGGVLPATTEAAAAESLVMAVSVPIDQGLRRVHELVAVALARHVGVGAKAAVRDLRRAVCEVYREVVGNPFRERVVAGPEWLTADRRAAPWMLKVSETARAIALGVQAEQAFDRLPILADALEDDGCNDAELLTHLRHHSHHLRGCWALDLVLGKS